MIQYSSNCILNLHLSTIRMIHSVELFVYLGSRAMRRTTCSISYQRNQPVNISCMLCSAEGDDAAAESPTVREAIHYLLTRATGLHTSSMADSLVDS